jgi:AraC-like DNA-binding protein
MHTIRSAIPDPHLKEFVRCFAQREMLLQGESLVQTSTASLEHIVAFNLRDRPTLQCWLGNRRFIPRVHLVGAQTRSPGSACFTGHVLAFGIFLKPFASWQLFRIPPAEFADVDFDGQEVLGPWVRNLWLRLAECKTFLARVQMANETLLRIAERAIPPTRSMLGARSLFHGDTWPRIQQLARESCMSMRNYERRFCEEIGIPPKLFARVARFQMAVDMKRSCEASWVHVAHELGYFDQTHMIKDFRAFGGDAPSRLIRMCGDTQPWSIGGLLSLNEVKTR